MTHLADVLPTPRAGHPTRCRCGATVTWAITRAGKKIQLNWDPDDLGDMVVVGSEGDYCLVRKAREHETRPRFIVHFAHCPSRRYRRAPGVRAGRGGATRGGNATGASS